MEAKDLAVPLLVAGYPVAVAVIVRWVPVVREQRTSWYLVHGAAMGAIIVGWALRRPAAVPANAAWLVVSTVWYRRGGRRRRRR